MASLKKRILSGVSASALICLSTFGQTGMLRASAQNPIIQTSFTPDPAPVVFGDELYVYTGRDRDADNDFYYMTGYQCFSTTDMQNWTNHGCIVEDTDIKWIKKDSAWASQCIERNGKYYYYITGESSTGSGRVIGVLVGETPVGPFKDVLGKELVGPNWDYIDPTVMIDDDGQAWLMFGNPSCYYVKLKEDMITLDGQIQKFNLQLQSGTKYTEGPWICKHGDLYYLVFASMVDGFGGESISYCTGPTVTGPWTHRGTIHEGSNCFTTHGGIIDYKGHSYSFYHKSGLPGGGVYKRSACCEEFTFGADGSIPALKPTDEGPAQLEAFNPYQKVEAETYCTGSGVKVEAAGNGSQALGFIENGDYVMIKGVDFGEEGAEGFQASVASAGEGGKIELHLDSPTGPIVGTGTVPVTGGWQDFETISGNVSGATGEHNLYLRFSGSDGYLFNVDWWQFKKKGAGDFDSQDKGEKVTGVLRGDINKDGVINAVDLTLAKRWILEANADSTLGGCDIDLDKKVQMNDIVWIAKFLTGEETAYPKTAEKQDDKKDDEQKQDEKKQDEQKQDEQKQDTQPKSDGYVYPQNLTYHEAPGNYFGNANQRGRVVNESYNGINGGNKCNVYLPYGYDENKKYNIFYLMHGGGENENILVYQDDTQIPNMLDHMIENKEIEPMIVVFPTFNKTKAEDFWQEWRESVVPFVEGKYSTYANKDTSLDSLKASRMHRAYGGFSMGSVSTWGVTNNCLDIVGYVMPLSGHSYQGMGAVTQAIDKFGLKKGEYFILACTGAGDIAYPNMNPQMDELKNDSHISYGSDFSQNNFYYMVAPQSCTHWWGFVRHYVYDALPLFFHENQ